MTDAFSQPGSSAPISRRQVRKRFSRNPRLGTQRSDCFSSREFCDSLSPMPEETNDRLLSVLLCSPVKRLLNGGHDRKGRPSWGKLYLGPFGQRLHRVALSLNRHSSPQSGSLGRTMTSRSDIYRPIISLARNQGTNNLGAEAWENECSVFINTDLPTTYLREWSFVV